MKKRILHLILCVFFLILWSKNSFAAVHTFDWNGSTAVLGSYPWELAANWTETGGTGDIPGSASTDIVRFGTNVAFINQPTLTLVNVTVASITIGTTVSIASIPISLNGVSIPYNIYNPLILTINGAGVVLTTGSISVNHAAGLANDFSFFQTTFTGTGSIVCTGDFAVGNATALPLGLSANVTAISSTIAHMTIDGNLVFNSCGNGSNAICYPYFSLDANKLTLGGQMQYVGTNSPLNEYAGDINSNYHHSAGYCMDTYATPTTLELQNANALATNALFEVDFTNGANAATVMYDDPVSTDVQTVYTSNSAAVGLLPYNYSSLYFSGASTKQVVAGALTISTEWNTGGTGAVDLTNNPTITDAGNWDNSTNVTHGSGSISVSGNMTNATGTVSLSTGALTIGGNMTINSGVITGSTSAATTTVGGVLTNSSTLTGNAENWTFGSGVNNATITAGSGTMTFSGTYKNNSPGSFTAGTGTVTFGGNYTANSGSSLTASSGNILYNANFTNAGTFTEGSGSTYYTGKYTNTGTYTAGSGMVYFNGAGQILLDNSAAGTVFNNVTINGSGTATISSGTGNFAISPKGSLYMVSPAKLTAGTTTVGGAGYLTLKSDSTSSATVYTPIGTTIKGNVNVQRYISSGTGTRGYRLMSSPVNVSLSTAGAGNLGLTYINTNAAFGGTTYYGGFTEGPGTGFTTNGSTNPIIYLYDESRPTNNSSFVAGKNIGIYSITGSTGATPYSVTTIGGTPPVTTASVSIPVGNSYLWYFVGSNQSTTVTSTRVPDATTLTATGYLNQGTTIHVKFWKSGTTTVPYDVTTGTTAYGINQIGNPYASTISLNTLFTDNYSSTTNPITPIFYELLPGGNYISYNAFNGHTSDTRASQYIVSGQGFLMQAGSASPAETITFNEDQKVAYPSSFYSSTTPKMMLDVNPSTANNSTESKTRTNTLSVNAQNNSGLHLQMSEDNTNYAQTGIYFSTNVSDKYVPSEDALQIDGGTPLVFLSSYSSDSAKLSINTMTNYVFSKHIRLYANATYTGTYMMSLADISGIDTINYNIFLIDNKMQDSVDLVQNKTYTFTLNTADTTTFGANRFVLVIERKPGPQYVITNFTGQKVTTGVQLDWVVTKTTNYTGYAYYTLQKFDPNGGFDSLYTVKIDTSVSVYNFIDTHPVTGSNSYRLKQTGSNGIVTYSAIVTVGYNSITPTGILTLYPDPSKTIMNVKLAATFGYDISYSADIYNAMGLRMSHQTVSTTSWTSDVSAYKPGIYVMEIKDTTGKVVGQAKFLKVE